jgi:Co/Zn/Cd efflux system component
MRTLKRRFRNGRYYRFGANNFASVSVNSAVLLAALGVFGTGTGTGWPDIIVAAIMSVLALQGSMVVLRQSRKELRTTRNVVVPGE